MEKYFSIGEAAKINNISIQALRLYDRMGLLKPAYIDPKSNYRYYTMDQFMYIDLIKYSRQIGAPLKELGEVLKENDIETLFYFIKKQHEVVGKEIVRLQKISRAVESIEEKIEYALGIENVGDIYFRGIRKRNIIDIELGKKDEKSDVEIKLRSLDKILEENEIMFEGESGHSIQMELLLAEGKLHYTSVYSTYCIENGCDMGVNTKDIQSGNFMCIAYLGSERDMAVAKLLKYIDEKGIKPAGIGLEVHLFNNMEQMGSNKALYELQILI